MSQPTDADILRVKSNLANMKDFNDQLYVYGNTKILNAYALLSQQDNHDLGLQLGINLLTSAFDAITFEMGPIGTIAGNFLEALVANYASATPVSLNQACSSLMTRFLATSQQADLDLDTFHSDPAAYWNNTYSGTVITPFKTAVVSAKFSDLATIDFPAKTSPEFAQLEIDASYALDQTVWSILLKNFVNTAFLPTTDFTVSQNPTADSMNQWAAGYFAKNKAYWASWVFVQQSGRKGKDNSYWQTTTHNLGTGVSTFSDGSISDNACNYLFIDTADNVIVNPEGLFHRTFVFTSLNIPTKTKTYQH